jgi:membrane-associated phospholipid phosphatase
MTGSLKNNWISAFAEKKFKIQLVITFMFLSVLLFSLSYFFAFIEARSSYKINDFILNLISPVDLSVYTFLIIYSLAIYTIIIACRQPQLFLRAVQAYTLMLFIRVITIYLIPLEAPDGIIPLQDPFVEKFFYGQARITKDLFFSGHVATVTLLFLVNPNPKLKWIYLVAIILVSVLIIIQHVHYSFDVLAAPLFAWGCWKIGSATSRIKT